MSEKRAPLQVRGADWSSTQTELGLDRIHGALERQARRRRVMGSALSLTVVALAAAIAVFGLRSEHPVAANLSSDQPASPTAKTKVQPSNQQDNRRVTFRDGSVAHLQTSQTQLVVTHTSDRAITVELPEGSAHFQVTPDPQRRFIVQAKGITVSVLGTAFTITHEETRTHVQVTRGRVQVDGYAAQRILSAGEAAWFGETPEKSAPAAAPMPRTREDKKPATAARSDASAQERFSDFHRRADYPAAYEVLQTQPDAIGSSPEDLMRAADAARYSGHPAEAVGYLSKVSQGMSPLAPTAAFTLGRLYLHQLGQPGPAADAYARARKLSGGGPLAEDALYREIEARSRAGQPGTAQSLARLYLKTYPNSRRADAVVRWGALP